MTQDMNATSIGDTKPRVECPYCKQPKPVALGVDAFPAEAREEVVQALLDGASFYECSTGCGKRWAVMKQKQEVSAKPMKKAAHLYGAGNRRERRKAAALARRKLAS
jgi:hypothetical protein